MKFVCIYDENTKAIPAPIGTKRMKNSNSYSCHCALYLYKRICRFGLVMCGLCKIKSNMGILMEYLYAFYAVCSFCVAHSVFDQWTFNYSILCKCK